MNIYDIKNLPTNKEINTILINDKNVRIERIVSTGQTTDWYNQNENEYVVLLYGNAKIEFENSRIVNLRAGDTLNVLANEKHRVIYTSKEPPCIWLCVFYN